MRGFLLVIGWLALIGAGVNALLAIAAFLIVAKGGFADPGFSVETFMRDHVSFLYWARSMADAVLSTEMADWVFSLPALALFPARGIIGGLIGWWALATAARMRRR